jgi:hypothetical protein
VPCRSQSGVRRAERGERRRSAAYAAAGGGCWKPGSSVALNFAFTDSGKLTSYVRLTHVPRPSETDAARCA